MLRFEKAETVAVVFRQGKNLVIPPFEISSDERVPGEKFEETARRIASEVGVVGSVDYALETQQGYADRAYLMTGVYDEFADSDFLVPAHHGEQAIGQHPYLSESEKTLLRSALSRFKSRSL